MWTVLAAMLVNSAARAQEDPLPQSVARPYVAYEAALEAGDRSAAMEAARQAWQAAEDERIARSLIGVLAANYADLAFAEADFEAASDAWQEAARIGDRDPATDGPERVRRWYMAALSEFSGGDTWRARSHANRAAARIDDAGGRVPAELRSQVYFLYTRAAVQTGAWGRLEDRAERAVAAFEEMGAEPGPAYAYSYYMLGLSRFFWGEEEASVLPFHMAGHMYAALGERWASDAQSSAYWVRLVTSDYSDADKAALNEAISATPYPDLLSRIIERTSETEALFDTDADPVDRDIPRYPRGAEAAGIEGVTLVRFDVSEEGGTENVEVVAAAPPQIFDEATVEAVEDWQYDPALRDSRAVRRPGVITEFRFSMCDGMPLTCARRARQAEADLDERDRD
ncbi:MAG: energy transducer TonB [Pseudomonadota bacterium]|nr:energy transducer TonB [Pseudomonadota bacterium]